MGESLDSYNRAIATDPTLTVAYLYRGGVCNRLQRYREALESYELALRSEKSEKKSRAVLILDLRFWILDSSKRARWAVWAPVADLGQSQIGNLKSKMRMAGCLGVAVAQTLRGWQSPRA